MIKSYVEQQIYADAISEEVNSWRTLKFSTVDPQIQTLA
jgi:hypothetical protein